MLAADIPSLENFWSEKLIVIALQHYRRQSIYCSI